MPTKVKLHNLANTFNVEKVIQKVNLDLKKLFKGIEEIKRNGIMKFIPDFLNKSYENNFSESVSQDESDLIEFDPYK